MPFRIFSHHSFSIVKADLNDFSCCVQRCNSWAFVTCKGCSVGKCFDCSWNWIRHLESCHFPSQPLSGKLYFNGNKFPIRIIPLFLTLWGNVCVCVCVYIQRHTQHAYHLLQLCFTTLSWQDHCFSSQPTQGPKSLLSLHLSQSANRSWWLFLSLEDYTFWVLCYRWNYMRIIYTHRHNVCTHLHSRWLNDLDAEHAWVWIGYWARLGVD